jgi:hypothetical protein
MKAAGMRKTAKTRKTDTMTPAEAKQIPLIKVLSMLVMTARKITSITPNDNDNASVMIAFVPLPSAEMAKLAATAMTTKPTIPWMKGSFNPTLINCRYIESSSLRLRGIGVDPPILIALCCLGALLDGGAFNDV